MFRTLLVIALILGFTASGAQAQTTRLPDSEIPEAMRAKKLPAQSLAGPRFGFTTFTGETARLRSDAGLEPVIT